MAFMFLVGDATIAGANSFATVAQYRDHYPGGISFADDVDLATVADTTLERHLVLAARMLSAIPWHGTIADTDPDVYAAGASPRLPFPRDGCHVGPGAHGSLRGVSVIDSEVVPDVVRVAQIELADQSRARSARGDRAISEPPEDRRDVLRSKRSIVGSTKTWEDPLAALAFPVVAQLLGGLYTYIEENRLRVIAV